MDVIRLVSPPTPCAYLPDRVSRMRYELAPRLSASQFMTRLRHGWRRFGAVMFTHDCPSCRMCQSLRVPVATFRPTPSQRRVLRKNGDEVEIRIGAPSSSPEKLDLLSRFHEHGHQTKGWPAHEEPDLRLFVSNPFPTEEWTYRVGERLVGVGYVDVLPGGLSAIYFFHDPAERHRSLGTFNVLRLIAAASDRGLPHAYLGYYVKGCRSLEYKGLFRPNEVLAPNGQWQPFITS